MFLKYLDLHNKILRDAEDPDKVAQELLENGYYVVGVNSHNDGNEVKNKEHYYRFFETHFELFEKKGLLMFPAVEVKIRDGDYSALPGLISSFSKKYVPVGHSGDKHHVPFLVFVHGGHAEANSMTCASADADLLCHPEKEGGELTSAQAADAAANSVGIEVNYREYRFADDKHRHKEKTIDIINKVKQAGGQLFLFTATIKEKELIHVNDLIAYGKELHADLVHESVQNVHDLIMQKYGKLLEKTHYSLDKMKERHNV